jgi:hypothetical protein
MSRQTAVEWFAEMTSKLGYVSADILNQAKEMEKEQIVDFYVKGCDDTYGVDYNENDPEFDRKEGERLYNETYGGDE